jgi:WD40 repeat protein/serine/threonine protein kinase
MNEEEIFHQALARRPEERAAYLEQACAGDPPLRAAVEALLRANVGASGFLEQPALAPVATVDEQPVREKLGTVIGPYKLMEQIGEGGMGLVFVAEQQQPVRRKVALKVIKPGMDTRQVIARFEAERQALALMDHPHIAKVLDGGETASGRPYFVMELVKGVSITDYCDQSQVTIRERLELFLHVCQAVQHAHQKGIIHRDIKPSNVLIMSQDGTPLVKVIDFGIAKAVGQQLTDKTVYTQFAQLIGTPLYMSPEQAGESGVDVDTRSDIYSLGVLLYELLTGTTPFDAERLKEAGYDELRRIIREEEPPKPSTRISTLGQAATTVSANRKSDPKRLSQLCCGDLDWIAMKALEKDRNRRYETPSAFARDVQRYLHDEPVLACPPSATYRFRKFARRNKAALAMTAVIALGLLTAGVALAVGEVRVRAETEAKLGAERQRADEEKVRADAQAERVDALEKWRRTAYYLRVGKALNEYLASKPERAEQFLAECPDDLRRWEWNYVKRLCRSERTTVTLAGKVIVHGSAFSPDAKRVAYWDGRYEMQLRDPATGQNPLTFRTNTFGIDPVFSPDGERLATLGHDEGKPGIKIWDAANGKELCHLRGLQRLFPRAGGVAWAPDGQFLAGTDTRGNLFVFDLNSGAERFPHVTAHTFPNAKPNETWPTRVAFSPDGKWVATSCEDDATVKIWDAETGKLVQSLTGGEGFGRVAFSPKGTYLAAFEKTIRQFPDRSIRVWDVKTGQTRHVLRGPSKDFTCMAFSPDDKLLAAGSRDTNLRLWDLATGQETGTYRGHASAIVAVGFSPDDKQVLSLDWDRVVKTWDATRGPEVLVLKAARSYGARHAAIGPDSKLVAAASRDTAVRIWDTGRGEELHKFVNEFETPMQVTFSPDGAHLAAAIDSGTLGGVKVWDLKTGRLVRTLPEQAATPLFPPKEGLYPWAGAPCFALAYSPDGKRLASGGVDRSVRVWEAETGKQVFALGEHTGTVNSVAFSRDGRRLVSASGGLRVNLRGPGELNPLNLPSDDPQAVPDVKVWDAATGKELLTLSLPHRPNAVAISPDGEVIATALQDNTARVYDATTGKEIRALRGHTRSLFGVAFSPDGHRLVTGGGSDESVKLWDAKTGEEIMTLSRGDDAVRSVAFSPDGHKIVAASDIDVKVWDATPLKE